MSWTVGHFAETIETGRARYAGNISNWGREPDHNRSVGGHRDSQHLMGLAVDMWFHNTINSVLAADFYKRQGLWVKFIRDDKLSIHVQVLDPSTRDPDL